WAPDIGAASSCHVSADESTVNELTELVAESEKRSRKEGYDASNEKATDLREAAAWLAFAKGNTDEALEQLRAATDHQDTEGGESVGIPARELLADMLLEVERPTDAPAAYKASRQKSP